MELKVQTQFKESFTSEDLISLQAGFSEVKKGKIRYTHAIYINGFLKKFWKLEPLKSVRIKINLLPIREKRKKEGKSWGLPPIKLPSFPSKVPPSLERPETLKPPKAPLKWYD